MIIRLVKNGIFPILYDKTGKKLNDRPATGFEIAGTIQGEGKLVGTPSIFIRTAGCNLRCAWKNDSGDVDICDTPYSSHNVSAFVEYEIEEVLQIVKANLGNVRHIVITGGEPTLQPEALLALCSGLKKKTDVHITLETNGTNYLPDLATWVNLFSISPKLKSSIPDAYRNSRISKPVDDVRISEHSRLRKNIDAIRKYINSCMITESYYGDNPAQAPSRRPDRDFQLKFVIASKADELEIKTDYLPHLGMVRNDDILLMPLGSNMEKMTMNSSLSAEIAIRNGWRFAHRVQIDLFGDKEGT